jgi:hypothetical protein
MYSDETRKPQAVASAFRLLVCGGRDYDDLKSLGRAMNAACEGKTNVLVIHGGARGADYLASVIAFRAGVTVLKFPADWDRYGKAAGSIRNQQMLDEGKPDLVLAAPGGVGTADMVRRARKAGVPVIEMPR